MTNFEEDNEYEVKRVSGRKTERGKIYYLVEWEGYEQHDNTWEVEENLAGSSALVSAFTKDILANPELQACVAKGTKVVLYGAYDPEEPKVVSHARSGSRGKKESPRNGIKSDQNQSKRKPEKRTVNGRARDNPNKKLRTRLGISCAENNVLDVVPSSSSIPAESSRSAQNRASVKDDDFILTYAKNGNGIVIPKKVRPYWQKLVSSSSKKNLEAFINSINDSIDAAKPYIHDLAEDPNGNRYFQGVTPRITIVNTIDNEKSPEDFYYVSSFVYGKGVDPPSPDFLVRCECEKNVCDSGCHEEGPAYNEKGLILVKPGTPVYECNSLCHCGIECPNRVVQRGRQFELEIFKTQGKGWGVRTKDSIPNGAFVEEYLGEVVSDSSADLRGKIYDKIRTTYLFDMDIGSDAIYSVDAFILGNASRFFNHSCDPNLTVFAVYNDSGDPGFHRLAFFARRDIKSGEELTVDYEGGESQDAVARNKKGRSFECCCGATNCRKFIHQ